MIHAEKEINLLRIDDGKDGNDGVSSYTHIRYSENPSGNPMVATPTDNTLYIGIYTGTSKTAPSSYSSYTWSRYTGKNGNGINVIKYYYAVTETQTQPSANSITSTTIPSLSKTNKYLWQKEVIDFTDDSIADKTTVILIAVYGDSGLDGKDGADGKNGTDGTSVTISSTSITYQSSASGTIVPTGVWSTDIPSVALGSYLWTKTVVNYSDGKSTTSYSVAYKGTNGKDGSDGKTPVKGTDYFTDNEIQSIENNAGNAAANSIEIGGRNLLKNSEGLEFCGYSGSVVTTETDVTVAEWSTSEAKRIYGTRGTNILALLMSPDRQYFPESTAKYSGSIYIKNNGPNAIQIGRHSTNHTRDTIEAGESKRTHFTYTPGNTSTLMQMQIYISAEGEEFDITYWRPKWEKGNKSTDWTPSPEDVKSDIADASKTATNYMKFLEGLGLIIGDMTEEELGLNVLISAILLAFRNGDQELATFGSEKIELGKTLEGGGLSIEALKNVAFGIGTALSNGQAGMTLGKWYDLGENIFRGIMSGGFFTTISDLHSVSGMYPSKHGGLCVTTDMLTNIPDGKKNILRLYGAEGISMNGKILADHVVEEGKSGNWYYRKWASGRAECYGSFSKTITTGTSWGSVYTSSAYIGGDALPFTFLYEEGYYPKGTMDIMESSGNFWITLSNQCTATSAPKGWPVSPKSQSNKSVELIYRIEGWWKK